MSLLKHRKTLAQLLALCALTVSQPAPLLASAGELPTGSLKIPPMVKEDSISTYLPSEAAPGEGLAVNIIFSKKARYKDAAPVVVVVPGGIGSQGLDFSMHAAQQGLIEVRFAFPGGGKPGFMSSGIYDNRGQKSQEALRDVLKFAAGQLPDYQNKRISDLLPYKADPKCVGAVGWSNGGNTLLVTMGKFAEDLPFVGWLAFYESPVGNLYFPATLGGAHDMMLNKHYKQGTGAIGQAVVDYKKLKYQKDASKAPGAHKKADEPEIMGVAYFDENNNGAWDETTEFAIPYSTDIGMDKQIYPPSVTKALWALQVFQPPKKTKAEKEKEKLAPELPKLLPPVATYDESIAYFRERDGSQYVKEMVQLKPELAVCIFGSHLDHLQRQPDHPHIAALYNQFLENKPKFLRLNPSSIYVGAVTFMKASTFVENRPNSSIDADALDPHLEPEGLIPDYAYMEAAVAELSDRIHLTKWTKNIEAPLVNFSNGAKPPEEKAATKKTDAKSESSDSEKTGGKSGAASYAGSSGKDSGKPTGTLVKDKPGASPASSNPKDWPFKK